MDFEEHKTIKRSHPKKYFIWLFPAALMVMIFCFSAQHAEESSALSNGFVQIFLQWRAKLGLFRQYTDADLLNVVSIIVRKGAHVTEYLILCTSFLISFRVSGIWKKRKFLLSFLLTFCYACTDEFHQLFVPGRAGMFQDVLIDSSGALLLTVIVAVLEYRKKRKSN